MTVSDTPTTNPAPENSEPADTAPAKKKRRFPKKTTIVLAILAVWLWWATTVRSWLIIGLHTHLYWVTALAIVVIAGFSTFVLYTMRTKKLADAGKYEADARRYEAESNPQGYAYRTRLSELLTDATSAQDAKEKAEKLKGDAASCRKYTVWMAAATVVAFIAAGFFFVSHPYGTNRQYLSSLEVNTTAISVERQRAPYRTAAKMMASHVNVQGDVSEPTYVNGKWTVVVEQKGMYSGLSQIVSWTPSTSGGEGIFDTAKFHDGASRKLGGYLTHNLLRQLRDMQVGVQVDKANDPYGYIADGHPYYVVPMTKLQGWPWPYRVPAGVAVVDENGKVTVRRSVTAGQIPGPVYPMSLAKRTREANEALGGFTAQLQNQAGYETSSNANGVTDDGDDERSNPSELVLVGADGHSRYVTPLTPRGNGKSIIAVAETDASSVTAGKLNPVIIHTLAQPRKANGEIQGEIKAKFADLEWASGLKVFELAPASAGEWNVTLGQDVEPMYRVRVISGHADTPALMLLYRVNGQFVAGVNADGQFVDEVGSLLHAATPSTGAGSRTTVDLTTVSDTDLLSELNRRLTAKNQPAK